MRRSLHGHLWTLGPHLLHQVRPERPPRDEPWDTTLLDPDVGEVRLTGWIRHRRHADTIAILVHGLGGNADSRYLLRLARACDEAGLSYLRLSLRGADRSGEDFYHAALDADLEAALASPALSRYRRVYLVGYSMGGHVSLIWATRPTRDPRVAAIAAVCAPLDLHHGAYEIQRPGGAPYQWFVLGGLKQIYRATAHRRPVPVPLEEAMEIRTILEWDEDIVAPRFGFACRADYYSRASVGPRLSDVAVPSLFVAAEADPMVTPEQLRPWLREASPAVEVAWSHRGGHVAFPDDLDLGFGDTGALEPQLVRWLQRHR